jgi:hypothetical protein
MQDGEHQAGAVLEFAGDDAAEQGGAGAVVDFDIGDGAGESGVTIEDDDAIAGGASGELGGESIGFG